MLEVNPPSSTRVLLDKNRYPPHTTKLKVKSPTEPLNSTVFLSVAPLALHTCMHGVWRISAVSSCPPSPPPLPLPPPPPSHYRPPPLPYSEHNTPIHRPPECDEHAGTRPAEREGREAGGPAEGREARAGRRGGEEGGAGRQRRGGGAGPRQRGDGRWAEWGPRPGAQVQLIFFFLVMWYIRIT